MQVEDPVESGGAEERSKATPLELCEIPSRRGDDALMVDQGFVSPFARLSFTHKSPAGHRGSQRSLSRFAGDRKAFLSFQGSRGGWSFLMIYPRGSFALSEA
jgi:hypothetical protein